MTVSQPCGTADQWAGGITYADSVDSVAHANCCPGRGEVEGGRAVTTVTAKHADVGGEVEGGIAWTTSRLQRRGFGGEAEGGAAVTRTSVPTPEFGGELEGGSARSLTTDTGGEAEGGVARATVKDTGGEAEGGVATTNVGHLTTCCPLPLSHKLHASISNRTGNCTCITTLLFDLTFNLVQVNWTRSFASMCGTNPVWSIKCTSPGGDCNHLLLGLTNWPGLTITLTSCSCNPFQLVYHCVSAGPTPCAGAWDVTITGDPPI